MKIHESYKYVVWIILLLIISPNVRSQIDKNQKEINVLDFGAIPNDGKHDTQALINVVKLARETPNSILFFPKGIYHISDSLALKIQDDASEDVLITGNVFNNCGLGGSNGGTIEGASAIALHVKAPNTNVAELHKRILIENNVINGGKHAIVIKGSEDVTIRNNSFKEIDGQPIIIGASIRVKAYNNEGGQPIGEKLASSVLPNLN